MVENKTIIWIIVGVLILLILNGTIELSNLFSISSQGSGGGGGASAGALAVTP